MSSHRPLYSEVVRKGRRQQESWNSVLNSLRTRGYLQDDAARATVGDLAANLIVAEEDMRDPNNAVVYNKGLESYVRRSQLNIYLY